MLDTTRKVVKGPFVRSRPEDTVLIFRRACGEGERRGLIIPIQQRDCLKRDAIGI